jgi:hypothetical protein
MFGAIVAVGIVLTGTNARAEWAGNVAVERFSWHEHTKPIEVHEQGPLYVVGGRFDQPKTRGPLLAFKGRFYFGSVDYHGSFQFDATKAVSGASAYTGATAAVELHYRWPDAADAVAGLDFDLWRRRLSSTQHEDYRIVSARFGVERAPVTTSRWVGGGGIRVLLATQEDATIVDSGVRYALSLSPGLGANPYLDAGYRVADRVTLVGYWDGMDFGRSNQVVLLKRGRPQAIVSQPETDLEVIGLRVEYGW